MTGGPTGRFGLMTGATAFGWLASQGRRRAANAIITEISGIEEDGTELIGTPNRRSLGAQIAELWTNWRSRLVYGMVLDFSGSAAYYGLFTFLSAYVLIPAQVQVSSATVPLFYLIGNIGALAGGFTVAVLIDRLGRTAMTALSYGTAGISVLVLALAALAKSPAATLATFTLCVFSATCSWVSVILAVFSAIGMAATLIWDRRGGIEGRGLSLDAVAPVPVIT